MVFIHFRRCIAFLSLWSLDEKRKVVILYDKKNTYCIKFMLLGLYDPIVNNNFVYI